MSWDLGDNALREARELLVTLGERAHPGHVRCGRDPGRPDHVLPLTGVRLDHAVVALLDLRVVCRLYLELHGPVSGSAGPADELGVPRGSDVLCSGLATLEPAHPGDGQPAHHRDRHAMTVTAMTAMTASDAATAGGDNQILAGTGHGRGHLAGRCARHCHRDGGSRRQAGGWPGLELEFVWSCFQASNTMRSYIVVSSCATCDVCHVMPSMPCVVQVC